MEWRPQPGGIFDRQSSTSGAPATMTVRKQAAVTFAPLPARMDSGLRKLIDEVVALTNQPSSQVYIESVVSRAPKRIRLGGGIKRTGEGEVEEEEEKEVEQEVEVEEAAVSVDQPTGIFEGYMRQAIAEIDRDVTPSDLYRNDKYRSTFARVIAAIVTRASVQNPRLGYRAVSLLRSNENNMTTAVHRMQRLLSASRW